MNKFLQKLILNDSVIKQFSSDQQVIHQGLAPIVAIKNQSITIQKANLLEQSKYSNWQIKASDIFLHFHKNNIQFLVFKGFAYSYLLYENSHIRPYSDIDILIQQSDYEKVENLLISFGFNRIESRQGKFISFQNSFYDNNRPQTIIDLHWQINNRFEFHQYFPFLQLYQSAVDIKTNRMNFKTLNQIDAFILACFHYQAHRPNDRKHIWLYDIALMWNQMDKPTQSHCLKSANQKQQAHIVNALLNKLILTFTDCFEFNHSIKNNYESSQDYLSDRNRKLSDIKIRFKNIKGFKNKLTFLSEYIFQSKSYMQNRYNIRHNSWIYFYYPRMWIEDFIKLFK